MMWLLVLVVGGLLAVLTLAWFRAVAAMNREAEELAEAERRRAERLARLRQDFSRRHPAARERDGAV